MRDAQDLWLTLGELLHLPSNEGPDSFLAGYLGVFRRMKGFQYAPLFRVRKEKENVIKCG